MTQPRSVLCYQSDMWAEFYVYSAGYYSDNTEETSKCF